MFLPVSTNHDITCSMHNVDSISVVKVSSGGTETVVSTQSNSDSTTYQLTSDTPVSDDYYCRGTKDGKSVQTTRYTYTIATTNVISGPTDQYTVGESVEFECEVPAGTTVSFKKTDDPSQDLSSQTSENSAPSGNTIFTLTISNPTESHDGEYFCEGNGGRSSGAMLNFVRILASPVDIYRNEAESATFVCSASGIVSIKWTTPSGSQDPDHTFVTESGNTIAELETTATEGGIFYCVAQDIVSSESAKLVVMKVTLTVPDAVKSGEEVEITCVVYGDHDGVTIANEGRLLSSETPADAMSTMASGEGTKYVSRYETALSAFSNGVSDFTCNAYYNNFGDVHKEEAKAYFVGFYKQPSDIVHLTGTFSLVSHVSSSPKDNIVLTLFDSEDVPQATKSISGGVNSVSFDLTLSVAKTDQYYYELQVGGENIKSDYFNITSYGAPITGDYEIKYPGSSLDSLTLTCSLRMPHESPVTWTNANGDKQGSDNPLISTSYSEDDQILTSTFTISTAGTGYSCSSTILETEVVIGYKVYLQNYALVPSNLNEVFFDNPSIKLDSSPSTYSPNVFAPDGTEIDISQPLDLYEDREFISVIKWTWGGQESEFYQTETVNVAGIYIAEPASARLVAGERSNLQCTATQTAHILAKKIKWTVPDGDLTSSQKILSLGSEPGVDVAETTVQWNSDLPSGAKVTITCSVDFSFEDGSQADITKVKTIVAEIDTKCRTTENIANGVINATASSIYPSEIVSVKCNDGFQLSGQSEYSCQGGQLWSTPPRCVERKPLCSAVAPTFAQVSYEHPNLLMKCVGDSAPFREPPVLNCLDNRGWNLLSITNPVSSFEFCGERKTPYSKSVTATVTYGNGTPNCDGTGSGAAGKKAAAFERYQAEVDLGLDGITTTLIGCEATADGYTLSVSWFNIFVCTSPLQIILCLQSNSSIGMQQPDDYDWNLRRF